MCKFYLMIFFIVGANCNCIPPFIKNEIKLISGLSQSNHDFLLHLVNLTTDIKTSAKTTCVSATENKMFDLDQMRKTLMEGTQEIMDQKFASISEVLQKFGHQLGSIQKNILENWTLQKEAQNSTSQKEAQNLTEDCTDVFNLGEKVSTSYWLQKYKKKVICDMETDGGGWLLIQQRRKLNKQIMYLINRVDFNRGWDSYKEGFGDLDTEFWIGNEFLHHITNQKLYELRIDMEDFDKGPFYATYSEFRVGNEESGYKLYIGEYRGNVTNRFSDHSYEKFSAFDRDNDGYSNTNCAEEYSGGFWYNMYWGCYWVHLNRVFPTVPDRDDYNARVIRWWNDGEFLVLIKVTMKIRPKIEHKIIV